jgi:2',3'-cyclic-nucleotide 2'-phosphodiesterase (5'-nucleotidase family)
MFVSMLRLAAAALCWCGLLAADVRPLTILHTNDLHARLTPTDGKGGFASVAAAIRREREGCGSCILLNAGDLVQGSPVSTIFRGLPVYEIVNLFAYDAATLGNHELDYGWEMTRRYLRTANYPIVSANVQDARGRLLTEKPYVILRAGGLRVAVIGAMTADMSKLITSEARGPWRALPVLDSVRKYAAEARPRADLVVVLGHLNPAEELQLLEHAPEVAVIVSGHSHRGIEEPLRAGERQVIRVRSYGEQIGRLDLEVDTEKKAIAGSTWRAIPVDSVSHPPAPDVERVVARWENEVAKVVDIPIGSSTRRFSRQEVKALMEQAMRERMKADFAFMNFGGVRDIIPKGVILARHVWNIMPFDNRVVIGKFRGSLLPQKVLNGYTVDPDREYTLAVTDFSAQTQSAADGLGSPGYKFPEQGPLLRDLLIEWIKDKEVLR